MLDTPVKGKEYKAKVIPRALRKTLPNIDELLENNEDDMEDV